MNQHDQVAVCAPAHRGKLTSRERAVGDDEVSRRFAPTSHLDETVGPAGDPLMVAEVGRCQFDFLDLGASDRGLAERAGSSVAWEGPDRFRAERAMAVPVAESSPRAVPRPGSGRRVDLAEAATIYLRSLQPGSPPAAEEPRAGRDVFRTLHEVAPRRAATLARGLVGMPGPGDGFLSFRLVEELGRGAFGRVFLARQGELADRLVALKVTAELPGESQTLAQLQHTNIVPIFSAHHAAPFYAVCMPYFGRTTLADLLDDVLKQGSLPESGQVLVRTVESRRSDSNPAPPEGPPSGAGTPPAPAGPREPAGDPAIGAISRASGSPPRPPGGSETLRKFDRLSYVETVLYIVSRIADGLAHAHERGIVHRDLKPANVLMTDDGQPMILDFNLSEDLKDEAGASTASVGGTLGYMSPEHIERFVGRDVAVDARSDLYALGVIFYELLTGRTPFPTAPSCSVAILHRMIAERRRHVPPSWALNPAISPAVDSIIRHCLEPDPAQRYQSALALREDLDRHLANLPLRHAPEPSIRERARKWSRRHPRLASTTSIVVLACCGIVALGSSLWIRSHRLFRFEAAQEYARFRDEASSTRFLLNHRIQDRDKRKQGQALARRALKRYGVLDDPGWASRPLAAALDAETAAQLRTEVAEILLMITQATTADAAERKTIPEKHELARSAQRFNQAALAILPTGQEPQAFRVQQAALVRLLGREEEGDRLQKEADKIPLRTARDHYLAAAALAVRREYDRALPLAEEAVRLDPQYFWAYFIVAVCQDHLEHPAEALANFTICTAFRPDFADTWLYRGLSYLKRNDPERARLDFDRAHRLRPDWYEPLLNRGVAYSKLGDHVKAENDLTRALELDAPETRLYFLRSAERRASGDRRGAELDLAEGLRREPTNAPSWISRGLARMGSDPAGALADFEAAVELEPNLLESMQLCAYLLCGMPGREEPALRMLDRIIKAHPEAASAWSGRGVQHAVAGRRDEAIRDARQAVWLDTSPAILYQVAGIYATTSKTHPEDRIEAYRFLSAALRAGFGFELLDIDRELDAIRAQPEFLQVVNAARAQAKVRLNRPPGH